MHFNCCFTRTVVTFFFAARLQFSVDRYYGCIQTYCIVLYFEMPFFSPCKLAFIRFYLLCSLVSLENPLLLWYISWFAQKKEKKKSDGKLSLSMSLVKFYFSFRSPIFFSRFNEQLQCHWHTAEKCADLLLRCFGWLSTLFPVCVCSTVKLQSILLWYVCVSETLTFIFKPRNSWDTF